jgi:hypothetical protein
VRGCTGGGWRLGGWSGQAGLNTPRDRVTGCEGVGITSSPNSPHALGPARKRRSASPAHPSSHAITKGGIAHTGRTVAITTPTPARTIVSAVASASLIERSRRVATQDEPDQHQEQHDLGEQVDRVGGVPGSEQSFGRSEAGRRDVRRRAPPRVGGWSPRHLPPCHLRACRAVVIGTLLRRPSSTRSGSYATSTPSLPAMASTSTSGRCARSETQPARALCQHRRAGN